MKNKGFSFVELIVAVAILGLVSLPVASSFVLAARMEAKAAILNKMNDAADDVMLLVAESDNATVDKLCAALEHSSDVSSIVSGESVTFVYNGYTVRLELTDCTEMDFCRIDLTMDYEANGSTYRITRKGVLS